MSAFFEEVKTQPAMLTEMLKKYKEVDFKPIFKAANEIKKSKKTVFCGMGSSFFAPQCILSRFRRIKEAFCIEASEMIDDYSGILKDRDVIVILSQSGESVEILKVLEKIKNCNNLIISITNNASSSLALASDISLELYAGEEKSITNKTFTNTLALLYLLEGAVETADMELLTEDLMGSVKNMQDIIDNKLDTIKMIAEDLNSGNWIHFIGRKGVSMTLANQSALIFMEGAATYANSFTTGAFRHGPIEICSSSHLSILYYCNDDEEEIVLDLREEMAALGSNVYLVTNMETNIEKCFKIKAKNAMQYSFVASVFMEILLFYMAENRGRVAGNFSITRKICVKE